MPPRVAIDAARRFSSSCEGAPGSGFTSPANQRSGSRLRPCCSWIIATNEGGAAPSMDGAFTDWPGLGSTSTASKARRSPGCRRRAWAARRILRSKRRSPRRRRSANDYRSPARTRWSSSLVSSETFMRRRGGSRTPNRPSNRDQLTERPKASGLKRGSSQLPAGAARALISAGRVARAGSLSARRSRPPRDPASHPRVRGGSARRGGPRWPSCPGTSAA